MKMTCIRLTFLLISMLQLWNTCHAKESTKERENIASAGTQSAAAIEQHWRIVLFDGRKVGHAFVERRIENGEFINREVMDLDLKRGGSEIKLYTEQVFRENAKYQPTGFAVRMRASQQESLIQGAISPDRQMQITQTVGGVAKQSKLTLAADVLFPEAQIKKLQELGFKPGAVVTFKAFDPQNLDVLNVTTSFLTRKLIEDYGGKKKMLFDVKQTLAYPLVSINAQAYVDDQFTPIWHSTSLSGIKHQIIETTRSIALAPNEAIDIMTSQTIPSPRVLTANDLNSGLRYTFKRIDSNDIENTGEQKVVEHQSTNSVDVCQRCGSPQTLASVEYAKYLRASSHIQSDHPKIIQAAGSAIDVIPITKRNDHRRVMQTLENYVREHMAGSDKNAGYASALEVLNFPAGDCTEHAILLVALARAARIPSRMVIGFAYAQNYENQTNVFVPHSWVQANFNGRWHSFDSALKGFDSGHIAIETGVDDPNRAYKMTNISGNLEIVDLRALSPAELAR